MGSFCQAEGRKVRREQGLGAESRVGSGTVYVLGKPWGQVSSGLWRCPCWGGVCGTLAVLALKDDALNVQREMSWNKVSRGRRSRESGIGVT